MQIALLVFPNVDFQNILDELSKEHHLYLVNLAESLESIEKDFAELSLRLEEKMIFENLHVDLVLVLVSSISSSNLIKKQTDYDIFFLDNGKDFSFYCSPQTLFLLGSLYKINFKDYGLTGHTDIEEAKLKAKILYIAERTGIRLYGI